MIHNPIESARALAPTIAAWRDAGDEARQLPRAVVDALRKAGMFALAVTKALGGADVDDITLLQVVEELARYDGSVGWNVMIAANGARMAAHLPGPGLREVYGQQAATVVAGSFLPRGQAVPVQGGYCLTGRWSIASGCHYASWLRAPANIVLNGLPGLRADGRPDVRVFHVPVSECEVLDTWRTTGLRATGSNDFCIGGVFVPEERSFPLLLAGPSETGALLVREVTSRARPGMAAVALGIARDAIDSFKGLATTKTPTRAPGLLAAQHTIHERVGRAEALVRSGRAFLWEAVREVVTGRDWSAETSDEGHAVLRLASTHATQNAAEAVDLMFVGAGTSAVYSSSRLERCFRDVHMVTQHVGVGPANFEMVGQYLLGLGLQERR